MLGYLISVSFNALYAWDQDSRYNNSDFAMDSTHMVGKWLMIYWSFMKDIWLLNSPYENIPFFQQFG